jgi:hypothetical protein
MFSPSVSLLAASNIVLTTGIEVLSNRLTQSFATKCLTPLELYIFKAVFKSRATASSGLNYWPQSTFVEFLGLPVNTELPIDHVIFQLASYVGAFPFPSQAPAILTNDALLRVVVVLTRRYTKVLRSVNEGAWEREIWRALAVVDRSLDDLEVKRGKDDTAIKGFDVDEPKDDLEESDDEDGLLLAAFDAMDATEVFKHGEELAVQHAMVPMDNFLALVMFMLLIAPLSSREPLKKYTEAIEEVHQDLRSHAQSILTSFGVAGCPGVRYSIFKRVITSTMPYIFEAIPHLFEHFLYPPDFDLSKRSADDSPHPEEKSDYPKQAPSSQPILPSPCGELMTLPMISHLSFILPPSILFRNLTLLYSGADDGFSMPTFQTSVFNWSSPTILLVSGTLLPAQAAAAARAFLSTLPSRRLPPSAPAGQKVVYGAYVPVAWKQTHRASFGTPSTLLFQLAPQHDVFHAANAKDAAAPYAYFSRHPSSHTGVGFGSPLPEHSHRSAAASASGGATATAPPGGMPRRRSSLEASGRLPLGPVSLHLDDSLTYAAFTHDSRSGGGAFAPSALPSSCRLAPAPAPGPAPGPPRRDWQDVFEVDQVEVYGLGGEDVLDAQRRARRWDEREAERRRGLQLRVGDVEADRELLKMAGLVGEGRSGGSM